MKRVILLDLDGTLIDSNDAHAHSWVETFKEFNIPVEFDQVRSLIGMGSDQLVPHVTGLHPDSQLTEKISERRGEIFRKSYLKKLKPFKGARELVQKFLDENMEVVVATSASESDLRGLLKQIGINDLIKHATSSDDADKSKPSPDIIVEAMKKVSAHPEECVMLGDTPYDIIAADRAGVKTIAFTSGGWKQDELQGAVEVYEGPWDLLREFDDSLFKLPPVLDESTVFRLRL